MVLKLGWWNKRGQMTEGGLFTNKSVISVIGNESV